ncbi:MAG: transposase [Clostridiales bacterium]|nr:transposase [Clostridiales bacterium]
MSNKKRYTSEEKYRIVKEALTTDSSVTEVCKRYGINTTNFYNWQKVFLESALDGFNKTKQGRPETIQQKKIDSLAKENQKMKDVIAEIISENITLKKNHLE